MRNYKREKNGKQKNGVQAGGLACVVNSGKRALPSEMEGRSCEGGCRLVDVDIAVVV
jgi:hypothetical protein